MPFFAAHCAIGCVSCGSVCETRTMYGERVVMTEVAAFMITIGFFASARNRRHRERIRRKPEAREDVDVVTRDQFLREPLGDLRRSPGRVPLDDLDLLAGRTFLRAA